MFKIENDRKFKKYKVNGFTSLCKEHEDLAKGFKNKVNYESMRLHKLNLAKKA